MSTDILFALADTGLGHRSVALALGAGIAEQQHAEVKYDVVDLFARSNLSLARRAPRLYERVTADCVSIYNAAYRLTNGVARMSFLSQLVYHAVRRRLLSTIREFDPKLIVVTHPFLIGDLVCRVRREHKLGYRVATVVADPVSFHASWACQQVDLNIVFSAAARDQLIALGISPARIEISSFPVHPDFLTGRPSRGAARQLLGVPGEAKTLLLTGGGAGAGINVELVLALEEEEGVEIFVVTGNNVNLARELTRRKRSRKTRIYGRVDNMSRLMAACDVVITKAGPSTIMEAAAAERPLIITGAVGRQEDANIQLALTRGWGVLCESNSDALREALSMSRLLRDARPVDPSCVGTAAPVSLLLGELAKTAESRRLSHAPPPVVVGQPSRGLAMLGLRSTEPASS